MPGENPGEPTEVDLATLDATARWLDEVAAFVHTHLEQELQAKLDWKSETQGKGKHSHAEQVFGGFTAATQVAAKHQMTVDRAVADAKAFAEALRKTADGTRKMAEHYRTAEDAAKAGVDEIAKLLSDGGGSSSASSSNGVAGHPAASAAASSPPRTSTASSSAPPADGASTTGSLA